MTEVNLKKLRKRYGPLEIIKGVDLEISSGEFVVFVGPSGSGKSTLLRMISGIEGIDGGELLIGGRKVNETPPAKRGIAMVFQSYALYPHMSVARNLGFALETAKLPKADIRKRVKDAAQMLQIEHLLDRKPSQLSGGQQQRVAIGRAVVRSQNLFLFDEPLSNLDADLRMEMRVEIANLHRRLGCTTIYVTHDQLEAMTLADRIVVLREGNIAQVGSPTELYSYPADTFVAGFIGAPRMNFLDARIEKQTLQLAQQKFSFPLRHCGDIRLGIRPGSIGYTTGSIQLSAIVRLIEPLGDESLVHLLLEDNQALVSKCSGLPAFSSGDCVPIYWEPSDCYLFDVRQERIWPIAEKL